MLLSHIKGLIFVVKFVFIFLKKASKLSFCFRFKINILIVSMFAFVFKILRPTIFSAVTKISFSHSRKFSLIKKFYHSQEKCPWSRNFSTVKEFFEGQGDFPWSRNFSIIKEFFHSQGNFSWSRKSRNFTTGKGIFHKKILLDQGNFPQTMKFSKVKEIFYKKNYLIKEVFHWTFFAEK